MYICNNCGAIFEDCKIVKIHHPYGEGTAAESWAVCPDCEENDFSEAKECERCGELVAELREGLCNCCYGDMYGE